MIRPRGARSGATRPARAAQERSSSIATGGLDKATLIGSFWGASTLFYVHSRMAHLLKRTSRQSSSRKMIGRRFSVLRSNVPRTNPTVRRDLRPPSNRERAMGPLVAARAAMAPLVANWLAGMLPGTAPGQFRFAALAAAFWPASVGAAGFS